jgi:hypothetical protein
MAAWQVLIDLSLHDRDEELRLTALDELVRHKDPEMVNLYVKALKNKDIAVINRAAAGLAAMGDTSAIGPLIDVLAVHQRITVKEGSNAIASRFPTSGGGGPAGLSMGTSTKVYERQVLNETVRDALVKLTGVNYGFDPEQWKAWHAAKRQQQAVSLRRDD